MCKLYATPLQMSSTLRVPSRTYTSRKALPPQGEGKRAGPWGGEAGQEAGQGERGSGGAAVQVRVQARVGCTVEGAGRAPAA